MGRLSCKLCGQPTAGLQDFKERHYLYCSNCGLIQKTESLFLDISGEKAHYLNHNNGPLNSGYVKFLENAITPLLSNLFPEIQALDYGCGPGPAMADILSKFGISCDNYDPIFFPDGITHSQYGLIITTECAEHFHFPELEFTKIKKLLIQGGFLSIMTELYQNEDQFMKWYYLDDPTHVSFFHLKTIAFLEQSLALKLIFTDNKRVFVFQD